MNRSTEKSFRTINGAIAGYCGVCRKAYNDYSAAVETAKIESEKYKDSEGEFRRRERAAAETARNAVLEARATLNTALNREADALNEEFHTQLLANPAPNFFDKLRTFRDFGLTPSRAEAETLLNLTFGSMLAIRALDKVLADTGAGLTVSGVHDFEKDIQTIRRIGREDSIYVPHDIPACVNVWKGEPRFISDNVGGVFRNGSRWDTISIATAGQLFESREKAVREMTDVWGKSFQPRISQLDQYQDREAEDGETVSGAEQFLGDLKDTAKSARIESNNDTSLEIAARRAENDQQAAEIYREALAHYTK